MADALLSVANIETYYGPIVAIRGVSFSVPEGSIVTILGANGAGKTTILKTVSGVMDPQKGTVTFAGRQIQRLDPDRIMRLGLSHVPEGREMFPFLTIKDNLRMGAYTRRDTAGVQADLRRVYTLFPRLEERRRQVGGTLSGGEQQMLAVGRALMSRPRLMLLDEPSMGLAPILIQQIFAIIKEINQQGTTVLLVEQNAKQALSLAHRAYVLETGRIVRAGTGAELLNDPAVQDAYLGVA